MARRKRIRTTGAESTKSRELTPFEKGLLKEAGRKVTIRVDGKVQEAEVGQVITSRHVQVAVDGSPHALGQVSHNLIEAQILEQALIREEIEHGKQIKAWLEQRFDRAVKEGADPLWFVPHPDDIVIVEGEGWSVTGPVDDEDLGQIKQHLAIREMLLLQSVLDERLAGVPKQESSATQTEATAGSTSLVLAHMLNQALPARFRMSIPEMTCEIMRYGRLTKRELLKVTHRGWTAIGHRRSRGVSLPPWCEVERFVKRLGA